VDQDRLNTFLTSVDVGTDNSVDVARKILDDKERVEVVFRQEKTEPVRKESQARAHTIGSMAGFIDYIEKYGGQHTVILADPGTGNMWATLDENAAKGRELIKFYPITHPLFAPWGDVVGGHTYRVRDLVELIRANKAVVVDPDPNQLIMVFSQVKVSKKVTMQTGFGVDCVNGVMCETTIQGKAHSEPVSLPESIKIRCQIFMETEPVEMLIDLAGEQGSDDHVVVKTTSSDFLVKRLKVIETMLANIQQSLSGAIVTLGEIEYSDWRYL